MKKCLLSILAVVFVLNSGSALAESKWQYEVAPYLWTFGFDGDVGVGGGSPDIVINAEFEDLFVNLEGGGGVIFEAFDRKNTVILEATYASMGEENRTSGRTVRLNQDNFMGTALWGYKPVKDVPWDLLFGARVWATDTEIISSSRIQSTNQAWVDALLGTRGSFSLSDKVAFNLSGLLGFNSGSNFEWELLAAFDTQINDKLSWKIGYRILGADHSDDELIYDVTQYGVVLSLGGHF